MHFDVVQGHRASSFVVFFVACAASCCATFATWPGILDVGISTLLESCGDQQYLLGRPVLHCDHSVFGLRYECVMHQQIGGS